MAEPGRLLARAGELAEDVLFPAAMAVDAADSVPRAHFDRLAEAGLYALYAPPELGGVGAADAGAIVETLAGACLSTAFVFLQHHSPVAAVAAAGAAIRENWLAPLARGQLRAAIAYSGLRPGAAPLRVRSGDGGYVLDGEVAWVTGWGLTDVVLVGALDADGLAHFLLLDAVAAPSLRADVLDLVAVRASRTATLRFEGHPVPQGRLVTARPVAEWLAEEASGSVLNGYLALGIAARCLTMIGPSPLDDELSRCRADLRAADPGRTPAARAAASELAARSAAALMVTSGSRAVLRDHHAQRLVREAAFLLVFGTRPAIRDALRHQLTGGATA